jgi:hypothetical protein
MVKRGYGDMIKEYYTDSYRIEWIAIDKSGTTQSTSNLENGSAVED